MPWHRRTVSGGLTEGKPDIEGQLVALCERWHRLFVEPVFLLSERDPFEKTRAVPVERIGLGAVDFEQPAELVRDGRPLGLLQCGVRRGVDNGAAFEPVKEEKDVADVCIRVASSAGQPIEVCPSSVWLEVGVVWPVAELALGVVAGAGDLQRRVNQAGVGADVRRGELSADVDHAAGNLDSGDRDGLAGGNPGCYLLATLRRGGKRILLAACLLRRRWPYAYRHILVDVTRRTMLAAGREGRGRKRPWLPWLGLDRGSDYWGLRGGRRRRCLLEFLRDPPDKRQHQQHAESVPDFDLHQANDPNDRPDHNGHSDEPLLALGTFPTSHFSSPAPCAAATFCFSIAPKGLVRCT